MAFMESTAAELQRAPSSDPSHADATPGGPRPAAEVLVMPKVLLAALAIGTCGLLRAARGYRSFPSIDDFTYLPLAISRLDSSTFTRDDLIQQTPLHVPLLPPLLRLFEATVGMSIGFWLLTLLLSVATVVGIVRLYRALGGPGALAPIAAVLIALGHVDGLGRGDYDGLFGDSFHFQWLALCALLGCYDALLRTQHKRAVGFLILALVGHPVVGAHGVLVSLCGILSGARRGTLIGRLAPWFAGLAAVLFVGSAIWMLLAARATTPLAQLAPAARGLLFRLPQEFEIGPLKGLLFLLIVAAGIHGGVSLLRAADRKIAVSTFLGLMAGHLALLGAACVLYEARTLEAWSRVTLLPFQLSLTRTTPLLLALAAIGTVAAVEVSWSKARIAAPSDVRRGPAGLFQGGVLILVCICLAVFHVRWSWQAATCVSLAVATAFMPHRRVALRVLTVAWSVAGIAAIGWFVQRESLDAPFPIAQQQLFEWARRETDSKALFVVPPSFQEFRLMARRSVYVDFKTVTPGERRLIEVWQQRLETVAVPDRLSREARGWEGIDEWDRTYSVRNSQARIERLLGETGADYWIVDRRGLTVPPFVELNDAPSLGLETAFHNDRYVVYRRRVSNATAGFTRRNHAATIDD